MDRDTVGVKMMEVWKSTSNGFRVRALMEVGAKPHESGIFLVYMTLSFACAFLLINVLNM